MTNPPEPPISIRPAQPEDASAIAHLGTRVFTTSFAYSLPAADLQAYLSESYTPAAIFADLENPNKDTIVAVQANNEANDPSPNKRDQILGFAILTRGTTEPCINRPEGTIVELQRLYVDSESHGQGLGRQLMGRVEVMVREQGFEALWLGVWEHNLKAQRFYMREGFEKVGSHEFVMGEERQTDWIMVRGLWRGKGKGEE